MKKAYSLKDVTDIKQRWPLVLHPYDHSPAYNTNPKPIVLHIIDREGMVMGRSIMGRKELKHIQLSKCNRVINFWDSGSWKKINRAIQQAELEPKYMDYKLCSRCGTADDFVDAMLAWDKEVKAQHDAYEAEQKERNRLAEETWERIKTASSKNARMLAQSGVATFATDNDNERYYHTEIDGHEYRVTITLASKPKDE